MEYVSVLDGVKEFTANMLQQLDLRVEAMNLGLFNHNFATVPYVVFPQPIYDLISEAVLVETFERGDNISQYPKLVNQSITDLDIITTMKNQKLLKSLPD
jgi:predicted unusual protein kinase regulating ubiquinone biosynthesis (AarF/ABC1/UbiB family)